MADVIVLCYHAVSPTWDVPLSVTPEALERHLHYLARSGWRAVTIREAVLDPPSARSVALTFDDAFASVKTYAAPLLAELRMPATVFAPTSYVSSGAPLAWPGVAHWQHTAHAAELTPMSWDDLRELADDGWEIASHTRTHPHLTQLDDQALRAELEQSREECALTLGGSCETIAYPFGDVDRRVEECVAMAGYRVGATLASSLERSGVYRFPRTGIYRGDSYWRFRLKAARPIRALRATRAWRRR